jgi:hypothetical protein
MDESADDQPTQKTQPKTDAEPIDIPVPTREEFLRNLGKVTPKSPDGPAKSADASDSDRS